MNSLLGLPEIDPLDDDLFDAVFAPRLNLRAEGFRVIFSHLRKASPTIIETGCLRALGNWSGDGQSTFLFETLIRRYKGCLFSIDSNPESIATAKQVCKFTNFINDDGTKTIDNLVRLAGLKRIDLLYLDSFDAFRDVSKIPAPVHYALEFCAAWPALQPGSLVAIDDFHNAEAPGSPGTKGLAVEMFLDSVGAEVLHDSYQKIWRIK